MADGGRGSDSREDEIQGLVSEDDIPDVEVKDGESVLKTAEKALKAVKDKRDGRKGKKEAKEEADPKETEVEVTTEDKEPEEKQVDYELLPPEGLLPNEKEEFLKMKYGPRRAFNRMWKRAVSSTQERFREIAAKEREHAGIHEAIYPYRDSIPEGHTVSSMINALMKVHSNIASSDEGKAFKEVMAVGERRFGQGFRDRLEAYLSGNENFSKNEERHPSHSSDPALLSRLDRIEQQWVEAQAAPIAKEFESVANERDLAGNFLFPELQNPDFVSWLNDKVVLAKRENPQASWGEAMKLAWSRATGRQVPVSKRPIGTSHQATNATQSRALSAAATTRGRVSTDVIDDEEMPDWATKSVEATARWALEKERRRLRA